MPNAQDQAFALLAAARRSVSPDALARVQALMVQRAGPGQTLAQALLEARLLAPASAAELLRELARTSFVCERCHDLRSYDALAQLPTYACPRCGQPLQALAVHPRDSRLRLPQEQLDETVAGPPAHLGRPSGQFVVPARPSGTHGVLPPFDPLPLPAAQPSGAFDALGGSGPAAGGGAPTGGAPRARDGAERTIGPYTLLKELGRGSNGVVYLARRPGLERKFAVKVLLARGEQDPESIERFRREAQVASRIADPGVIAVFDVGRHAGHDYYAMEFCAGETLEGRLRRGPLDPVEAARLIERLASTVHAAHELGVVHRDLKPANVILEEGTGRPRILDFGLARDRTRVESLTRSGDILGTPYYMAPEQIAGDRDLDQAIDVYALGVILYQCLTGERPFEASSVMELAEKIAKEAPRPPRSLRSEVPPAIEAVCLHAMAKEREDRPPTAKAMATALAAATRDERPRGPESPLPLDDSTRRLPAEPPPRPWLLLGGIVAAGLVVLVGGIVVGLRGRAGSVDTTGTEPPPPLDPEGTERAAQVKSALERVDAMARQRVSVAALLAEVARAADVARPDAALARQVTLVEAGVLARRADHARAARAADQVADDERAPASERAEALRLAGLARERLGDLPGATAALRRAFELDPDGVAGLTAGAALARLGRDAGGHRTRAVRAAQQTTGDAPALLERAAAELDAGDASSAAATLRAAAAAAPDDVAVHLAIGVTSPEPGRALAAFDEAIRLAEPTPVVPALLGRARRSVAEGRVDQAVLDLERVLAATPGDVEALVLRGQALWGQASITQDAVKRAAAEESWRAAHARDADAFVRAAEALPVQMRAAARAAARLAPGSSGPADAGPVVVLPDEVRARLERWVLAVPEEAQAPLRLALVAAAEGAPLRRFDAHLRQAREAAPDSPRLALLEARLLVGRDAYAAAIEALERARELQATPAGMIDLLHGEALWFAGQGRDAVKLWEDLAKREPTSAIGLTATAWVHLARSDEARGVFTTAGEALRKDPDLVSAHLLQGMVKRSDAGFDDALACFDRALALEGAIQWRTVLFRLDTLIDARLEQVAWSGKPSAEIDQAMERMVALFALGGATARMVAAQNAALLGPGSRWSPLAREWLDEAQRAEPDRAELDVWQGFVTLYQRGAKPDDVLRRWLDARRKDPRVVIPATLKAVFRDRFGDHPELRTFPER